MAFQFKVGDVVKFNIATVDRLSGGDPSHAHARDMRGTITDVFGRSCLVETGGSWNAEDGRSIRGIPMANLMLASACR